MGMYEWIHDRVQGKPMPVGGVVTAENISSSNRAMMKPVRSIGSPLCKITIGCESIRIMRAVILMRLMRRGVIADEGKTHAPNLFRMSCSSAV